MPADELSTQAINAIATVHMQRTPLSRNLLLRISLYREIRCDYTFFIFYVPLVLIENNCCDSWWKMPRFLVKSITFLRWGIVQFLFRYFWTNPSWKWKLDQWRCVNYGSYRVRKFLISEWFFLIPNFFAFLLFPIFFICNSLFLSLSPSFYQRRHENV